MLEISYWKVVEGREADLDTGAKAFKKFCNENLDATFDWGYVLTGKHVGDFYALIQWKSHEAYGKWQDSSHLNKEYQSWVETVFVKNGPPDHLVDLELIQMRG